jgi:hypothetical protein
LFWLALCPSLRSAYPDLVLFGHDYVTVTNGADGRVDGTSASSPSLAGMFVLITEMRSRMGQKPLGFLNYLLYQAAATDSRAFTDITEGSNRCLESSMGCCSDGFSACSGFDPVTGLGTPNFQYLQSFFNVTLSGDVTDYVECVPSPKSDDDDKKKLAIIIGSVVGGVVLLALLVYCWRRSTRKPVAVNAPFYTTGGAVYAGQQAPGAYARMS